MKILENKFRTWKTTCPNCSSLLLLYENDIQGGDVSQYFYKCAACNKVVYIASEQIPKIMRV